MPGTGIAVRRAGERGISRTDWLDSRHTFSFGEYRDTEHMGFRSLRVINEDRVAPGRGFPPHPHRDMEIFSYVLEGRLEHRDSLGNGSVLGPGRIQVMSAGTGVTHSEFNPDPAESVHFLQVWILPERRGLVPSYAEWRPSDRAGPSTKDIVISRDGREESAVIRQDAEVYRLRLAPGTAVSHELRPGRGAWLQVVRGGVTFGGEELSAGDGASAEVPGALEFVSPDGAEALLFDLV